MSDRRTGLHDFAFQTGEWRVKHRKLRHRLAGDIHWDEFFGRCRAWEMMGGEANADDHVLDDPGGARTAASLRRCDPATGTWSIWWWDSRRREVDPPVVGSFRDGIGTFFGDDSFNDQPIRVRFIWSAITPTSAQWEQAFSEDGGRSWETNWIMQFERGA